MDALNHVRQRQLRDVVTFFMQDSKNDPEPVKEKAADADKPQDKVKTQPRLQDDNDNDNYDNSTKNTAR